MEIFILSGAERVRIEWLYEQLRDSFSESEKYGHQSLVRFGGEPTPHQIKQLFIDVSNTCRLQKENLHKEVFKLVDANEKEFGEEDMARALTNFHLMALVNGYSN